MGKIDSSLWKIMQYLNKNKFLSIFVKSAYLLGFVHIYNKIVYHHDKKHPTDQMIESKKYFYENIDRIDINCKQLEDDISRSVYKNIIQYRITHDSKLRGKYNKKNQYFPEDLINIHEGEVFIDCGAYIGDTIISFIHIAKKGFKKIIAFEPDLKNSQCIKKIDERIVVINAAVWKEDTDLYFEDGLDSSSKICEGGKKRIKAYKIDSLPECADATFIKMDIEGAEYNALLGAYNTIKKQKPTLAVCIYHSDEDMIRIQELIASWNLGYSFYIRHHAEKISETVLYAIQKNDRK